METGFFLWTFISIASIIALYFIINVAVLNAMKERDSKILQKQQNEFLRLQYLLSQNQITQAQYDKRIDELPTSVVYK
ncbi:DUF6019 family protein [Ferruginibacter yonginensis]|uniref:DUF6019 family protein n=1 Tax=Ferruginibacter yonginensis TaxID=1310416 RepID=A0ABV8QQK4_9BACT